ncbi:hypothetical protein VOI54_13480 [Tamlana sp. 2201CG12-4]|uniref:hypothetical protein n=1 Tax=Tamlana sp. 2201CG12-4 TaxID=3112582 RepID=UPI002DBB0E62|nr:hypothetical protein [Tamlana sp. 2201CG12-4]MEC3908037.1 hypothetical protein [Tamlana sp. 2201CG12-4]
MLLLILSMYYLHFTLNDNEENYLQLAKAFYEPDWIVNSFVLTESAGTRLLYQYIIGFFLNLFSFELVVFIFRGLFIIAFSLVLHKIYKSLKINNIIVFAHLFLIYLDNQSYFAGSRIFISVEAKTFAYLFVFLALNFIIQKKYNLTVLFLIVATYFHILVGFYAFGYMAISILIIEKWDFRSNYKLILKLFVYVLAILPFVFVLYSNINTNVTANLKPSSDWIYTYFRNPHHTTLINAEFSTQLKGILYSVMAMLFLIYMYRKENNDSKMKVLYLIGIVTYAGTLLLVPLIFIDKNGTFLKFYLFRINAFSTFIFTLTLTNWLYKITKEEYKTIVYAGVAMLGLIQLATVSFRQYKNITYSDTSLNEVCEFIKSKTDKESNILGLANPAAGFDNDLKLSLTRKMERDMFVVYKFVPADLNKIHEWYKRVKIRNDIAKNINLLTDALDDYKIDYVLSKRSFKTEFLKLEFNNNSYFLYKVEKR